MTGRLRGCLAAFGTLAILTLPSTAVAEHNADQHSPNMLLNAELFKAGDLSPPADSGLLAGANSDFAFWGDRLYAGHYDGLRIIDISDPDDPSIITDFACRGPQNDVSVWRNRLLIQSIDTPQEEDDDPTTPRGACTTDAPLPREDPTTFEGIRIIDVSNPAHPRLIKGVDTDCGSHTHTLVPDRRHNRLLVYVASYPLRSGPVCGPNTHAMDDTAGHPYPGEQADSNPLHDQISVVEIPLNAPEDAEVINEPRLHRDHPVWVGADLGEGFNDSRGCHDIQVFLELKIAAAACMSDGELWDISDLDDPKTEEAEATDREEVDFWHSAAFTWDGKYVTYSDESILPSCTSPSSPQGRMWTYRTRNIRRPVGSFMIPRPQGDAYCTAHLFNYLPFKKDKRYVMASSWYNGGVSMIDWTNPRRPVEIGYYDRVEGENEEAFWTGYWYDRNVYGNHIEQGQFFFDFLSRLTNRTFREDHLNPQTQEKVIKSRGGRRRSSKGRPSLKPKASASSTRGSRRAAARHLAP